MEYLIRRYEKELEHLKGRISAMEEILKILREFNKYEA